MAGGLALLLLFFSSFFSLFFNRVSLDWIISSKCYPEMRTRFSNMYSRRALYPALLHFLGKPNMRVRPERDAEMLRQIFTWGSSLLCGAERND